MEIREILDQMQVSAASDPVAWTPFQRTWNWDVNSIILQPETGHRYCSALSPLAMGQKQGEINCESLPL